MKTLTAFSVLALLLIAGCSPTQPPVAKDQTPKPTESGTPEATPDKATPETKPTATRENIPAEAKTLAYSYSGLEIESSPTFEVKGGPMGLQSGAVETELLEIKDGSAIFRQKYTGSLEYMGTTEVMANKDGVFSIKLGENKVDPPQKELPANPKPGDQWTNKSTMKIEGSTIEKSEYKVLGIKKIKVRAGEFETLAVKAIVTAKRDNKPQVSEVTAYYAKKIGPVKLEIRAPGIDGKIVETTMEATKLP